LTLKSDERLRHGRDEERDLRIELMKTQIDKNRLDLDRVRQEMRWEPWKALAGIAVATAAMAGLMLAVARLMQ
jgi:hypothetical protein